MEPECRKCLSIKTWVATSTLNPTIPLSASIEILAKVSLTESPPWPNLMPAGLQDALLASVTYMTHPNLPKDPKWKLTRYASPIKTQTSSYIYLPSDHFFLRVIPTLTPELRSRRNQKLCVSLNWQLVAPNQQVPGVYDFRLHPGENVIAVDVIAELKEGDRKEYAPPQLQVDFERITFIIFLVDRS